MKPLPPLLLLLFFLAIIINAKAQDAKKADVDFYGNAVNKDICTSFGMSDDREAVECMDKICDAADIPHNTYVLKACSNINNCYALYKDDIPYIVYDMDFFNKVKTFGFTQKKLPGKQVDWIALTILAHELGHHTCGHTTNRLLRAQLTLVDMELQADEYAGGILYKLGATLAQAQEAMNSDEVPEDPTLTHPGRKARLAAIEKGYNKELNRSKPVAIIPAINNTVIQPEPVVNPATVVTPQVKKPIVIKPVLDSVIKPIPPALTTIPNMVLVQGGIFKMGNNDGANNEKPVHAVTVGSFYISQYEVTQAKWQEVMGYNPSANKCDNCPVEKVSWDEAIDFCNKLSNLTGKTYRLPTEAEWEYAARGGNKSKGYFYSGSNDVDEVGWYESNSDNITQPVGKKKPNELGLYDMTGNVWEWCGDLFGNYTIAPAQNPQGPSAGSFRVFRGGTFNSSPQGCSAFVRGSSGHGDHISRVGFRTVISL